MFYCHNCRRASSSVPCLLCRFAFWIYSYIGTNTKKRYSVKYELTGIYRIMPPPCLFGCRFCYASATYIYIEHTIVFCSLFSSVLACLLFFCAARRSIVQKEHKKAPFSDGRITRKLNHHALPFVPSVRLFCAFLRQLCRDHVQLCPDHA